MITDDSTWNLDATNSIAVCISTFGDLDRWERTVRTWAMPSVEAQTEPPARVTWCHGPNLQVARNHAARPAGCLDDTDWLCFLDADDELDPSFIAAMAAATENLTGDWLLQPATLGIHLDLHEDPHPVVIPRKNLLDGNFMVISTLIHTEQFHRLGGFADWPIYEDWDLWLRAWRDGAQFKAVPDAVLRVHVNPNGRNNGDRASQVRVYNEIRSRYL
jgi:glycosyltransferase involved in cell wall biosynthesis